MRFTKKRPGERPPAGLNMENRTHDRDVVCSQAAQNFLLKIVCAGCRRVAVSLLVCRAAFLNVVLHSIVKIFVLASFGDLGLVVQFDFIDQQAGETLRLAMDVGIFRGQSGEGISRSSRRGGTGPMRGSKPLNHPRCRALAWPK